MSYKYNSIKEMFEDVFGKDSIKPCKFRKISNAQKKKNAVFHKAICDYIKMLENAFKASSGSTIVFK